MADIYDIFYDLQSSGFYDFALPFLLVFTIVFAILEKTKIFGMEEQSKEPKRNINLVVSIVIGLIVINQFEIVDQLNLFLPKVSLFIIIAVMFLILVGIFGANVSEGFSGVLLFIFAIASLLIIYWSLVPSSPGELFGGGGSDFGYWLEDNASLLIFLVIVGIIIWAVAGPKKENKKGLDGWNNVINTMFGKGK